MKKRMKKPTRLLSVLFLAGIGLLAACMPDESAAKEAKQAEALRSQFSAPRIISRVDGNERIAFQVHMAMRNAKAAQAELGAIIDPENPRYGKFLSNAEYDAKYAPSAAAVGIVRAYLENSGLRIKHIPSNHAYIAAEGSAAQIEQIFATRLGYFRTGMTLQRVAMEEPTVPRALASQVLGIVGLSTAFARSKGIGERGKSELGQKVHPYDVPPSTCSTWYGQIADTVDPVYAGYTPLSYAPCGYKPAGIRAAYGLRDAVRRGIDGTGQTVAIVGPYLSPTLLGDAQTFAANNDPDYPLLDAQFSAQMAPGTPTSPDTDWYSKQTMAVEAVHAIAPGAKIAYVGAQSADAQDLLAAINMVVEKKLADLVANSWGMLEQGGGINFVVWHALATQAGLKGVGLYFASGDNGDAAFDMHAPSVMFPASLDNVTAIGGTSLALGRTGNILWETGWESGYSLLASRAAGDGGAMEAYWDPAPPGRLAFGSGGGISVVYEQPAWQRRVVPDAIANGGGAPARAVPDVAWLADPITGFIVGMTNPDTSEYFEGAMGGTSLSCPLFTAAMALAQQNGSRKFGFANPLLYKRRATALRDIVAPSTPQAVALPGGIAVNFDYPEQSIHTASGWDAVTGLGVPKGEQFLDALQ